MTDADDEPVAGEGLRSLIRMAREEFDEEPSPRLDALLMAAARKHAPEPKLGLFARMRKWLGVSMMNPAIAGATALVVIGGTAGVLYLRNPKSRLAEPTVSGPSGERGPAPVIAPTTPETATTPDVNFTAPAEPVVVEEKQDEAPKNAGGSRGRPKPKAGRDEGRTFERIGGAEGQGAPGGAATVTGTAVDGLGTGGVVTEMKLQEESPPPPPPPPRPPRSP